MCNLVLKTRDVSRQAVATHSDFAEHSAERPEGECELGNDLLGLHIAGHF